MNSGARPVFSVVVPAYKAGRTVAYALDPLLKQETREAFEIIVVDSGPRSCAAYVRANYPGVRVIRSSERLRPGSARNCGVEAARGEFIGFVPADGQVTSTWISARLAVHRRGFPVVGGAIANGTPRNLIGTAGYLLEYSAMLPKGALLREQGIPHALSFHRSVLESVGPYREDTLTGEDTLLNRECLQRGFCVGFAPQAAIAHANPTELRTFLSHAYEHGRGLAQCVRHYALPSAIGPLDGPRVVPVARAILVYPAQGWLAKLRRLRRHAPEVLPSFFVLSPMILLGLLATGAGAAREIARD